MGRRNSYLAGIGKAKNTTPTDMKNAVRIAEQINVILDVDLRVLPSWIGRDIAISFLLDAVIIDR